MLRGPRLLRGVRVVSAAQTPFLGSRAPLRASLSSRGVASSVGMDALDDDMFPQLVRSVLAPASNLSEESIHTISHLLMRDKCTVPFLIRYRQREMTSAHTGSEVTAPTLFLLQQELEKWTALVKLRNLRIKALSSCDNNNNNNKAVDVTVVSRLQQCLTRPELDEVYDSVKPASKKSKVQAAKEVNGLENVATVFLNERKSQSEGNSFSKLDTNALYDLLKMHKLRKDDPEFCNHLQNYLADYVAHTPSSTASAKELMLPHVRVVTTELKKSTSKVKLNESKSEKQKNASSSQNLKFKDYFEYNKLLRSVPSHQTLAIRRGKDEGSLKVSISVEEYAIKKMLNELKHIFQVNTKSDFHPSSILYWRNKLMMEALSDAIKRLVTPMITRLAWKKALEKADEESLDVFASNLRHLLMTPPLMQYLYNDKSMSNSEVKSSALTGATSTSKIIVCGIDPGFASGHKVVVLAFSLLVASVKPEVLCCTKVFTSSKGCVEKMSEILLTNKVQVVAIGNGTGSREAQGLTQQALKSLLGSSSRTSSALASACKTAVVSEVGASVYSVSQLADAEYPEMDVVYRGAISIAGRLVDPLREMVKVPPPSLGVGMYQHDIKESILSRRLGEVLEEIVSECGIDLNMASEEMLCYVSGVQPSRAKAIVAHREDCGPFKSRDEIKCVKGIGETTYRNCAGFLRIYPPTSIRNNVCGLDMYDPLDATNVHPEMYSSARVLLTAAWNHLNAKHDGNINNESIRQLLFSQTLQTYFASLSQEQWENLASICSEKVDCSEAMKMGLWLSADEFCGDGYNSNNVVTDTSCKGLRARRGQPPQLTSVTSSGVSETRKAKRDRDDEDGVIELTEDDKISKKHKKSKTSTLSTSETSHFKMDELRVGQEMVGVVRNLTAFGAFIDIGISRDALLHISEFTSKKYAAKRTKELVIGTAVRVRVKNIDSARDRISLSQVED